MSMAHSLELRVPYLDREVLREAECYPDSYKLRGDTKAVLRTAANKTLPDAWANRTKKASRCRLPSGSRIRSFPPRCARALPAMWPQSISTRTNW